MIRTFVINLARNPERRVFMEKQLDFLGMSYEIIEGVDGKTLPARFPLFDPLASSLGNGQALTKGELGCALSHRSIYEKMLQENISRAFILEDDVVLSKEIIIRLNDEKFLSQKRWDWLQVDYNPVGWWFIKDSFRSALVQIKRRPLFLFYFLLKLPYIVVLSIFEKLRDSYYKNSPTLVTFYRPLYLASAYVVTLEGARKLLEMQTPVKYAADKLPNQARLREDFKMAVFCPLSSHQEKSFPSQIASLYDA